MHKIAKNRRAPQRRCGACVLCAVAGVATHYALGVGDIISGNYQNKGAWYPGRIVKVLARKGYYNVKYDGDSESNVATASAWRSCSPPRKMPPCAGAKAQAQSAKHRSTAAATTVRRSSTRAEGQES